MSFPPPPGQTITSIPQGGSGGLPPPRIIFESSPGAPLLVISRPGGALGGQPYLAGLVFDLQVTSMPFPASGGQTAPQLNFVMNRIAGTQRPLRVWERDVQNFAIRLERERHVQALWQYGELTVFVLMWTVLELTAGLAVRCPRCFAGTEPPGNEAAIASAYGQGNQYKCPTCFNTQLVAASPLTGGNIGIRALILRPTIFTDVDPDQQFTARGVVYQRQADAESTPDFRIRNGDYMMRSSGNRYRLRVPKRTTLRTGFAEPWQATTALTYNHSRASVEDPTSVAYILPPTQAQLSSWLVTYTRVPVDYSWAEIINGPLIPEVNPPATGDQLQPNITLPAVPL